MLKFRENNFQKIVFLLVFVLVVALPVHPKPQADLEIILLHINFVTSKMTTFMQEFHFSFVAFQTTYL